MTAPTPAGERAQIPMERHAALVTAVQAVVDQAKGRVRHDDADQSGVTIHVGLLRALAEAAGLDPLPAYSEALARSERIQAYLNTPYWCGRTGE